MEGRCWFDSSRYSTVAPLLGIHDIMHMSGTLILILYISQKLILPCHPNVLSQAFNSMLSAISMMLKIGDCHCRPCTHR